MTIIVCIWSATNQLVHISKIDIPGEYGKKVPFGAPTFFFLSSYTFYMIYVKKDH